MSGKGKDLTRRDLLKGAGAAGLGSLLLSTGAGAATGGTTAAPESQAGEHPLVSTRQFGKSGVRVSMLSLGGMFDIPSNQLVLKQAFDWGVTYWDTADCYGEGKSEEGIGKFFAKYPDARSKVFLATKSDSRDPEGMSRLLDQSLERMKTDYIDFYLLHGVNDIDEVSEKTRQWVEQAKAGKKIKLFGLSTHKNMERIMLASAKLGWIDGIMMTYNFRIMQSKEMKEAVEACIGAGMGLTAMKTQGGGPVSVESEAEIKLAGRFLEQGFTDKQARLKAVWENHQIASICSQMPNMTILMSNVAAALNQTKLSAGDWKLLERYASETGCGYCAGCAHICEMIVAGSPPISDVMRYLMYFQSYGDRDRARDLYAKLPEETRDILASADFSPAERRCPQRLHIGRLMRDASILLA